MLGYSVILFSIFYMTNQSVTWSEVSPPGIARLIQHGGASSRSIRATACVLPAYPDHGTYVVSNVNDFRPGQSFDTFLLEVSCQPGYGIQNTELPNEYSKRSTSVFCVQGEWYQTMPKCVRFCKLDPDPSVDYQCHLPNGGFKSCNGYLAPGTLINPVCNSPVYTSTEIFKDMKCSRGRWNYIAKCNADCGRVLPKGGMGLVTDGTYSRVGEVPWHVGIYRKTLIPYEQICGGSLVSNKVVISAAHCFANRRNPSHYAVAGGKIYRPWNDRADLDVQKSDVKRLKIPRLYHGQVAHFAVDIAGLILLTSFILDASVRPVCLNYDTNFDKSQLQPAHIGRKIRHNHEPNELGEKVAGWGLTSANGNASPILLVTNLPFVNEEKCLNNIPEDFKPYITIDKFCAGYTNGTALCRGDSGGGLAFPHKEGTIDRFYLRGIVSTAASSDDTSTCNDRTYTAFTRIATYQDFIKGVIALSERLEACQGADCDGDCGDGSFDCEPAGTISSKSDYDSCQWKGIKGKCTPAHVCFTTLDKEGERPPWCPDREGKANYICCTDCQLVNDTRNFVISPLGEKFWKDGRKARDVCLRYLKDVPHKCDQEGNSAGITRSLNTERKCHSYETRRVEGHAPSSGWEYAYVAMFGSEPLPESTWEYIGVIISEYFILAVADTDLPKLIRSTTVYAAVGVKNDTSDQKNWQLHSVKKIHVHPLYSRNLQSYSKYNDIALFELQTAITFSPDVLPACLPDPAEEFYVGSAKYIYWDSKTSLEYQKINNDQCNFLITEDKSKLNSESQMCYKFDNSNSEDWFTFGAPLMVTSQYSFCMNTVIGLYDWEVDTNKYVFTKVRHYTPWIESIVWPSTSTKPIT